MAALDRETQLTRRAIVVSLFVDLSDVIMNVVVAIITGSAVMMAEAMQGSADMVAIILLMIGHKRANKQSTKLHPFGYGKELYFWTQLSAFIIFSITASLSFFAGLRNFRHPDPVNHIYLAYIVLAIAIVTNLYALGVSAVRILEGRSFSKIWRAFFDTYHVAPKTTFILDLVGTISALFGVSALIIYQLSGIHSFDGLGAMFIGVMLGIFAVILLLSIRDLITGRSAPPNVERKIRKAALSHPAVQAVLDLRTMIIGSDKILVNIELHLSDDLTTDNIEEDIDEIKTYIRRTVPSAYYIQVEPETPAKELRKSAHSTKNQSSGRDPEL